MPRLKNRLPSYRRHKQSGQEIVTLSGQDFLLGPYALPMRVAASMTASSANGWVEAVSR